MKLIDTESELSFFYSFPELFLRLQITGAISPSVRPVVSKGNQCYLLSSRFVILMLYVCHSDFRPLQKIINQIQKINATNGAGFCYMNSLAEVFPEVALNFAGGASMVLRPIDYLVHMGFVVSLPLIPLYIGFFT